MKSQLKEGTTLEDVVAEILRVEGMISEKEDEYQEKEKELKSLGDDIERNYTYEKMLYNEQYLLKNKDTIEKLDSEEKLNKKEDENNNIKYYIDDHFYFIAEENQPVLYFYIKLDYKCDSFYLLPIMHKCFSRKVLMNECYELVSIINNSKIEFEITTFDILTKSICKITTKFLKDKGILMESFK